MNASSSPVINSAVRRIVVTTDFSLESRAAFAVAKDQLRGPDDSLVVLHVVEDLMVLSPQFEFGLILDNAAELLKEVEDRARSNMEKLMSENFCGTQFSSQVVRAINPVHKEIVDFCEKLGASMIVMSTHGRTGLAHLILGSVAENVVRTSSVPVLVVPLKEARRV